MRAVVRRAAVPSDAGARALPFAAPALEVLGMGRHFPAPEPDRPAAVDLPSTDGFGASVQELVPRPGQEIGLGERGWLPARLGSALDQLAQCRRGNGESDALRAGGVG